MRINFNDYVIFSENELVLMLKNDDKLAFEQIYNNYKVRLYHNILKMIKNDEQAEELLQEVFVKIWVGRANINPEKSFGAYLFKISENLVYDFFRKAALNKKFETHFVTAAINSGNNVERHIYYKESEREFLKAIDKLPPRRKEIYILCKIEGKSYDEASRLLGISISTVNEHIVKASRTVRKFFQLATHVG